MRLYEQVCALYSQDLDLVLALVHCTVEICFDSCVWTAGSFFVHDQLQHQVPSSNYLVFFITLDAILVHKMILLLSLERLKKASLPEGGRGGGGSGQPE